MSAFNGLRVGMLHSFGQEWSLAGNMYYDDSGDPQTFLPANIAYGSGGNDHIGITGSNLITYGRLGDDTILFSEKNDVVSGGGGADTFVFSSSQPEIESRPTNEYFLTGGISYPPNDPHAVDVITDFRFSDGDKLKLDGVQIVSVEKSFAGPTEAYGVDLGNRPKGTDLKMVLTDGEHTETLWLLDAWTGSSNAHWVSYLHEFGYWGPIA